MFNFINLVTILLGCFDFWVVDMISTIQLENDVLTIECPFGKGLGAKKHGIPMHFLLLLFGNFQKAQKAKFALKTRVIALKPLLRVSNCAYCKRPYGATR